MDFSTDLIKLMPSKFHSIEAWQVLFEKFGEMMNEVHADIDGLADLNDKDDCPDDYMQYVADLLGFSLTVLPGTETTARRRMLLKSSIDIIKRRGLIDLITDMAYFMYLVEYPDITISVHELWTNDYSTFRVNDLSYFEVPTGWTGNGVTKAFSGTLAAIPVRTHSIQITTTAVDDTALEAYDNDLGVIVGDVESIGSIDYTTGAISLTFDKAPQSGEDITVRYTIEDNQFLSPHWVVAVPTDYYALLGATAVSVTPAGWVGNGIYENFITTLSKYPVKESSMTIRATDIYDQEMVVTDDGNGNLIGDIGSGNNDVDYATGDVDVTFMAPVKTLTDIVVTYTHLDVYQGRQNSDEMFDYLDRYRPVHTVRRIELGLQEDFWRVEMSRWRVGGPGLPEVPDDERIRVGSAIWL